METKSYVNVGMGDDFNCFIKHLGLLKQDKDNIHTVKPFSFKKLPIPNVTYLIMSEFVSAQPIIRLSPSGKDYFYNQFKSIIKHEKERQSKDKKTYTVEI